MSGGAVTVNFTAKDSLFIYISGASNAASAANNYLQFNSDTGSNYGHIGYRGNSTTGVTPTLDPSTSLLPICELANGSDTYGAFIWVYGANSAGWKPIVLTSVASVNASNSSRNYNAYYKGTSTITSLTLTANGTTFDAGTIFIYGA